MYTTTPLEPGSVPVPLIVTPLESVKQTYPLAVLGKVLFPMVNVDPEKLLPALQTLLLPDVAGPARSSPQGGRRQERRS